MLKIRKEGQRVTLFHNDGSEFKGTVLFERPNTIAITMDHGGSMRINKSLLKDIKDE